MMRLAEGEWSRWCLPEQSQGPQMPRPRDREPFGTLPDGTPVESVVLTGANGVSARIMTLGATLQALERARPVRAHRRCDARL